MTSLLPYSDDYTDDSSAFALHIHAGTKPIHRDIHRHRYYELFYLLNGYGRYFNDFKWYDVEAETLIIIKPGNLHTWVAEWGQFELFFIGFRIAASSSLTADFVSKLGIFKLDASPLLAIPSDQQPFLRNLFSDAYSYYSNQTPYFNDEVLLNYIRLILLQSETIRETQQKKVVLSVAQKLTQDYFALVETSFAERKQVQDYAELLGVTSNHLVRTVRTVTGRTPKQIIDDRLLLEAKRLLIHTIEPASTISQMLSFPSATKFGRWFKNQTQLSPGDFREKGIDA